MHFSRGFKSKSFDQGSWSIQNGNFNLKNVLKYFAKMSYRNILFYALMNSQIPIKETLVAKIIYSVKSEYFIREPLFGTTAPKMTNNSYSYKWVAARDS
jgi:hypothetical protein